MASEVKKIGEILLEAGIISNTQLKEALRHQRIAGGRMGSNLVALGFITESVLMDFLAQQTGVARADLTHLDVPVDVLARIPRRLAEQIHVLPLAIKEPKTLVLAMTDPLDINAIDSARFASGMNVEPLVANVSALIAAIANQYRKLEMLPSQQQLPLLGNTHAPLPVRTCNPSDITETFSPFDIVPKPEVSAPLVVPARSQGTHQTRKLESFQTRTLLLGLIKLLQRQGTLAENDLQHFLTNLIEREELKENELGPERGKS